MVAFNSDGDLSIQSYGQTSMPISNEKAHHKIAAYLGLDPSLKDNSSYQQIMSYFWVVAQLQLVQ